MSTYNKEKEINTAIVQQAESDAPRSGFNYKQFYVAPIDERGNIRTDNINADGSIATDKNSECCDRHTSIFLLWILL
jgi:hypothetical protein